MIVLVFQSFDNVAKDYVDTLCTEVLPIFKKRAISSGKV